jgi:hypothetical protein
MYRSQLQPIAGWLSAGARQHPCFAGTSNSLAPVEIQRILTSFDIALVHSRIPNIHDEIRPTQQARSVQPPTWIIKAARGLLRSRCCETLLNTRVLEPPQPPATSQAYARPATRPLHTPSSRDRCPPKRSKALGWAAALREGMPRAGGQHHCFPFPPRPHTRVTQSLEYPYAYSPTSPPLPPGG